jgi:hypothetical protein
MPLTRARQVSGPTMPSAPMPSARWKPITAALVLGPKMPSTARPWAGSPERLRNWNSSCTPRTASPVLPLDTTMIRAPQVCGPTTPSTVSRSPVWKAFTAASVFGPKIPSTVTGCPRARSKYCKAGTGWPWLPRFTSGHG